jgi:lipopolysaccharide/colanic/teichoic acid biosynthesis glycosyltransferase
MTKGVWSTVPNESGTFYTAYVKRVLDLLFAAAGLVFTLPLLLVCGVAIRLDSEGPALFRQRRIGKNGHPFQIMKLRTMYRETGGVGPKLTARGDARITRLGRWLRGLKIDELPQLFNVLRGEMSLVGPRPEVPEYVALYDDRQREVLAFRPGVTGPASLAYVNEESMLASQEAREDFYVKTLMVRKLELDLAYCQGISLLGDLRLIILTLGRILSPSDSGKVRNG